MLKKCLDKCNRMPRSCAAAVNLPKCQYFDQMVFLNEKSVNKVTEANLSNLRRSLERFFQNRTNVLHFLVLAAAIAATLILQRKVQETKKRRTDSMQPDALRQSLEDCDELIKSNLNDENGEHYLFCWSLFPLLKEFLQREKRRVKIKIMQLIYELQYGIEE